MEQTNIRPHCLMSDFTNWLSTVCKTETVHWLQAVDVQQLPKPLVWVKWVLLYELNSKCVSHVVSNYNNSNFGYGLRVMAQCLCCKRKSYLQCTASGRRLFGHYVKHNASYSHYITVTHSLTHAGFKGTVHPKIKNTYFCVSCLILEISVVEVPAFSLL